MNLAGQKVLGTLTSYHVMWIGRPIYLGKFSTFSILFFESDSMDGNLCMCVCKCWWSESCVQSAFWHLFCELTIISGGKKILGGNHWPTLAKLQIFCENFSSQTLVKAKFWMDFCFGPNRQNFRWLEGGRGWKRRRNYRNWAAGWRRTEVRAWWAEAGD